MSTDNKVITVKILGKDYQVVCPIDKQHELIDASSFLNDKMAEIKKSGKVIGLERITMMAALNVCHELLTTKRQMGQFSQKLGDSLASITENHLSFAE